MGKPAARVGDIHECPMATPGTGTPHVGGKIEGPGCGSVLIEGLPAATAGDPCLCIGGQDKIIGGSSSVFIEGKPAARMGDPCAHGGVVISGCGSVLIGDGEMVEKPVVGKKKVIISKAIKAAIELLTKKLELLEVNDTYTLAEFKRWFGRDDDEAKGIIGERIKRALVVIKKLTIENFVDKSKDEVKGCKYAEVYGWDKVYRIYVSELFWKLRSTGQNSKAGIIIHELSHFEDIGNTKDYVNKNLCLILAKINPQDAICNADSFELFIVG